MAGKQGIVQLDLSALNEALDKIKSFGGKVDDLASGNNLQLDVSALDEALKAAKSLDDKINKLNKTKEPKGKGTADELDKQNKKITATSHLFGKLTSRLHEASPFKGLVKEADKIEKNGSNTLKTFLRMGVVASLIVGPFVFLYALMKHINELGSQFFKEARSFKAIDTTFTKGRQATYTLEGMGESKEEAMRVLSTIDEKVRDITKWGSAAQLGLEPEKVKKDPTEALIQIMDAAQKSALPEAQKINILMNEFGMSLELARDAVKHGGKIYLDTQKELGIKVRKLDEKAAREAQLNKTRFGAAWDNLSVALFDALGPSMTKLMKWFTDTLGGAAGSKWFDDFVDGVKSFTTWIMSVKLSDIIEKLQYWFSVFVDTVKLVSAYMVQFADAMLGALAAISFGDFGKKISKMSEDFSKGTAVAWSNKILEEHEKAGGITAPIPEKTGAQKLSEAAGTGSVWSKIGNVASTIAGDIAGNAPSQILKTGSSGGQAAGHAPAQKLAVHVTTKPIVSTKTSATSEFSKTEFFQRGAMPTGAR